MAAKRMFTMKICDSDAFLDMPLSTQCLYFHLNMRADDDGFIGNPKRVQKVVGASEDDLKLLIAKRFVLAFEDGVIVIKHWRMHNTIQADRYTPTAYQDEKGCLILKENKSYSFTPENGMETKCFQNVSTDIDIDKGIGIDKDSDIDLETDNMPSKSLETESDTMATIKDIVDYLNLVTGSKYRYKTKDTQKHIKARLKDGYSFEDFKDVIDKKYKEWKGTEFERYLAPDTLFGTKFEKYLNQNIVSSAPKQQGKSIDWDNV